MKKRLGLLAVAIGLAVLLSGCSGALTNIRSVNPSSGDEVSCDTRTGTDCYASVTGEINLPNNTNLCLHLTFNRGTTDYWDKVYFPLETADKSKVWSLVTFGMGKDNPYRLYPFLFIGMITDQPCTVP